MIGITLKQVFDQLPSLSFVHKHIPACLFKCNQKRRFNFLFNRGDLVKCTKTFLHVCFSEIESEVCFILS